MSKQLTISEPVPKIIQFMNSGKMEKYVPELRVSVVITPQGLLLQSEKNAVSSLFRKLSGTRHLCTIHRLESTHNVVKDYGLTGKWVRIAPLSGNSIVVTGVGCIAMGGNCRKEYPCRDKILTVTVFSDKIEFSGSANGVMESLLPRVVGLSLVKVIGQKLQLQFPQPKKRRVRGNGKELPDTNKIVII